MVSTRRDYGPHCQRYTAIVEKFLPRTHNFTVKCHRRSNRLWTRTLGRNTMAGLPECVVSTISGPPPERAQDRTQTRIHT